MAWSKENPDDWIKVWNKIEEKWNRREPCPEGANAPFNIDAKLNGGYIAIGMLYGKGDLTQTIRITTRCGQDSDCNPARSAGVLGVVLGYKRIPEEWKSGISAICGPEIPIHGFFVSHHLGQQPEKSGGSGHEEWWSYRRGHADHQDANCQTGKAGAMGRLRLAWRADRHRRR